MGKKSFSFATNFLGFMSTPFYLTSTILGCKQRKDKAHLKWWNAIVAESAKSKHEGPEIPFSFMGVILLQIPLHVAVYNLAGPEAYKALWISYPTINAASGFYEWWKYEKNKLIKK